MANKQTRQTAAFHSQLLQAAMGIRNGVDVPVPRQLYEISGPLRAYSGKKKPETRDYRVPMATRYFGEASPRDDSERGIHFPKKWPFNDPKEED